MNGLQIAVVAVVALFSGIGLCLLGVFCIFMLRMMKELQRSAEEVTRVSRDTLKEAQQIFGQVKESADRNFGDHSAISRAAKSVSSLSNSLPEIMGGLKLFNDTFSKIYRTAFNPDAASGKNPSRFDAAGEDDSAFVPYSEPQAAEYERAERAKRESLVLSDDVLSMMRTDKHVERPEAQRELTPEA